MILPESTIWIAHLRKPMADLSEMLDQDQVLGHPFVTGEVALGSIANRVRVLDRLDNLPQLPVAEPDFVALMIESLGLWGKGVGYVDTHLLASLHLTPGTRLWSRDKRLAAIATGMDLCFNPDKFLH